MILLRCIVLLILHQMASNQYGSVYNMIRQIRLKEEILLYDNLLSVEPEEMSVVTEFLKTEYDREASGYPGTAPAFDDAAAGWAARTLYIAAQLILYRNNNPEDLNSLLPSHTSTLTPGAALSADLCLRFLPQMILQLKVIDTEDPLIPVLEKHLQTWHFSGVDYSLDTSTLDFTFVVPGSCIHLLYCDRIVQEKKLALARHELFFTTISAGLGLYGRQLWNEFITSNEIPVV